MNEPVKINPSDVPDDVYDIGCYVLSKCIRRFFKDPKNRKGYEEWMKTPEGQRAEFSPAERALFDAQHNQRKEEGQ